jgi:hypothetical protein
MEQEKKFLKIFNFNQAYVAPTYTYNKKLSFIEWGKENKYPQYLLDLYNNYGASLHKNIINKKTKLISGQGFEPIIDPSLASFVDKNKLEREVKKATLDYELFNGFALEVIWNNEGSKITSINHIPFHKLRIGIQTDEIKFPYVWFSNDWNQIKKEEYTPELIRMFNPFLKQGKQIYFYTEYNPSADGLYPIVGYSTSMNWIELGYEISRFHLNQAKQGYAPSFLLNFSTGIPSEEEQDVFFKEFKKNFAGTENAGKIILTYSDGTDQKPELIPIQLNDSDDRFILLMEQVDYSIVSGAEIPPQMVILTPGKLGSTEERAALSAEFQKDYISPRQTQMEEVLNEILSTTFSEKVILKKSQL